MEKLRAAERAAKEKRLNLYASLPTATSSKSNGSAANGAKASFEALVVRVWSGDQISVVSKEGGKERRIQLSSTRAPRCVAAGCWLNYGIMTFKFLRNNEPTQAFYAAEAREVCDNYLTSVHPLTPCM